MMFKVHSGCSEEKGQKQGGRVAQLQESGTGAGLTVLPGMVRSAGPFFALGPAVW